MSISGSDISLVLSGGAANTDPNVSLGGDSSSFPVGSSINNLFSNISKTQANIGLIDYRCFYAFNNHATDSLFDTELSLASEVIDGSSISFGIVTNTDIQRIAVDGVATGGSFTISYEGTNVVVNYNSITSVWRTNIQNGLNALPVLSGVVVTADAAPASTTFLINFEGNDDNKQHAAILLVTNALIGGVTVTIDKTANGGPINRIAPAIDNATTVPTDVIFATSALTIGTLAAGDGFPIWIKRTTLENSSSKVGDGFTLRIGGSPVSV